jgi:hypothetical protein
MVGCGIGPPGGASCHQGWPGWSDAAVGHWTDAAVSRWLDAAVGHGPDAVCSHSPAHVAPGLLHRAP